MHIQPSIQVLSEEAIDQVHKSSLRVLSEIGIRVDSENAQKIFQASKAKQLGITISYHIARFSPEAVNWAIDQVPSTIDIYNRCGEHAFRLGEGQARFGIGVTNLFYQEPENHAILPFSRSHLRSTLSLGNSLQSYEVISTVGILHDVDVSKADLVATLEMLAGTTKPLIILISDEKQFKPVLQLIDHLLPNTSEKPFVIPYFNPVTPLILNRSTADNMIRSIEKGIPIIYSNYGMAGVSSPITSAGTLALLNAELLAGLIFTQLIKPGAQVILGSLPAFFDMKNMLDFFDPQTMLLNLACAEMMHFYQIPHAGTSGSTNGWGADLISSQSLLINQITSCMGKIGLAPFIGGCFDSKVFSPELVVFASEIIEQSRQFARGFELDEETLGFEDVKRVGIGGNFIGTRQTMKLFRQAYHTSTIFPRYSLEKWQECDEPGANQFLREKTLELINSHNFPEDQSDLLKRGEFLISHARF